MPLYEFRCDTCGDFERWRRLEQSSQPMCCPSCEAVAKRVFSPPMVNLNTGSLRPRTEAAKEPRLLQRSQDREAATPRYQQKQGGRPWMISH